MLYNTSMRNDQLATDRDQEWLSDLFEFEDCEECGQGVENHRVTKLGNNRFAQCLPVDVCSQFEPVMDC